MRLGVTNRHEPMNLIQQCRAENINDLLAFRAVARGAELHPRRGADRRLAVGAEPHDPRRSRSGSGCACSPAPPAASRRRKPASGCCARSARTSTRSTPKLAALSELRDKPAGTIRITTGDHAAETILWPALAKLLPDYPDIKVEIIVDSGFDRHRRRAVRRRRAARRAGGEGHDRGADRARHAHGRGRRAGLFRRARRRRARRRTWPRTIASTCACRRYGGLYAWEFEKDGRAAQVRVDGQLVVQRHRPVPDRRRWTGFGLAYLPEDHVREHRRRGEAGRVLEDWCPPFPGYHLYYPSRRQQSPAFAAAGGGAALPPLSWAHASLSACFRSELLYNAR